MPLADLSLVTRSLSNLLDLNIRRLMGGVGPGAIQVTAQPPERVAHAANTLNLYLFHASEDPHYRNQPGPGIDGRNIARAPLSLSLFYVLTAHHEQNPDLDALTEQRMMGFALKTLHDFPIVDDDLVIDAGAGGGPEPVLDAAMRGHDNALRVILRPMTPEDSINFWSAQDQNTTRFSAYYEVRVVQLAPEPPQRFPGIVLSIGQYVRELGAARLTGSRSILRFALPLAAGGGQQAIEATPAQALLDPAAVPPVGAVTLTGENLTLGLARAVVLRTAAWRTLAPPVARVELDPAINPAWAVRIASDRIDLTVQPTVTFVEAGVPRTIDVLPGVYAASLRSVFGDRIFAGERRVTAVESNQVAFGIGPRIAGHGAPDPATGRIRLDIAPVFDLTSLAPNEVELIIASEAYVRLAAFIGDPAIDDGAFVVDPAGLVLQPLFDPAVPGFRPLRLVANGVEAQPFWIES